MMRPAISSRVLGVLVAIFALTGAFEMSAELGPQKTTALAPLSYVCPMPGDEEVLEDKPGQCPKCKMNLVPVRLDEAWTCPNHPAVITTKAGTCPIDKRELVQVTVALSWTCPSEPGVRLTEPGRCADGKPREEKRELRAHGDHNPRHGGQFFMAEDRWHHLEGTYPSEGRFRLFTYDNFTKALDPRKFSGRVVTREERDPATGAYKEFESFPLKPASGGKTLDAHVKNGKLPLTATVKIKFDEKLTEQRFDFTFTEFSKEPPIAPPAAISTKASPGSVAPPSASRQAAAPAVPGAPAATVAVQPTADAPSPPSPAPAAPTEAAVALAPSTSLTECSTTMSRSDALRAVETLPSSSGELIKLIAKCGETAKALISEGQLGAVYLAAMLGKDMAIALESHASALRKPRTAQAEDAIRRLVLAAWELDLYSDLGNRAKLAETYELFAAAVTDITSAFDVQR